jgi:hypothetical protein
LSTTLAIYQPEKHHVQREEIKDVYQAQDEEILLGHLQAIWEAILVSSIHFVISSIHLHHFLEC